MKDVRSILPLVLLTSVACRDGPRVFEIPKRPIRTSPLPVTLASPGDGPLVRGLDQLPIELLGRDDLAAVVSGSIDERQRARDRLDAALEGGACLVLVETSEQTGGIERAVAPELACATLGRDLVEKLEKLDAVESRVELAREIKEGDVESLECYARMHPFSERRDEAALAAASIRIEEGSFDRAAALVEPALTPELAACARRIAKLARAAPPAPTRPALPPIESTRSRDCRPRHARLGEVGSIEIHHWGYEMFGLGPDGSKVWRRMIWGRRDLKTPHASALIGRLVLVAEGTRVVAIDARTGRLLWARARRALVAGPFPDVVAIRDVTPAGAIELTSRWTGPGAGGLLEFTERVDPVTGETLR
jgi:hypothetical protein